LKRRLKYRKINRPDMTVGCNEKLDLDMICWIWNFPTAAKPKIETRLKLIESSKKIVRLKSALEAQNFLLNLQINELES
jgi:hypothetical protein